LRHYTEEAFEKESAVNVSGADGAGAGYEVEIDHATAWRERFHDNYWRKVVGALAADEDKWQGLTLVHFSAQPEPYLTQRHTLDTP